ncbi:MAG: parallel beta-helix domain-containing protein [Pirellulaceae bacterium]
MNRVRQLLFVSFASCLVLCVGCGTRSSDPNNSESGPSGNVQDARVPDADMESPELEGALVVRIAPGDDAQRQAQEALITAQPGDTIEFEAGIFEFSGTLSLDGIDGITIRGKGLDQTILNFASQRKGTGGEGLLVKAHGFTIEDLTIQNTPGDAIKVTDSRDVVFRRVRTWWSDGASQSNGAYGIYPVMCDNVLIEHCVAEHASDAGIYVGQSRRAIVRRNRAERNVAGIEIENTIGADVYENDAIDNTGGILVFSLPGLQQKNGSQCRVFNNRLLNNNHVNFAQEGAMVATVPPGTGLMIMANDQVEVFGNTIEKHKTTGIAVISFLATQRKFEDPQYDPFPEEIDIHDNQISEAGYEPQGLFGEISKQAGLMPMAEMVIDGLFNPEQTVNGTPIENPAIRFRDNGEATFLNLGLASMFAGGSPTLSQDIGPFKGGYDALPEISGQWAEKK